VDSAAEKAKALKQAGWTVITLWECRVKKDVGREGGACAAV